MGIKLKTNGINAINAAFAEIESRIAEIVAKLGPGSAPAANDSELSEQVALLTKAVAVIAVDIAIIEDKFEELNGGTAMLSDASNDELSEEFNWRECKDRDLLEKFGRTIGIEVDKRKTAENIHKAIEDYLNQGAQ